ncbi:hypothetical protein [uncultured Celeribacter sp.]|uniref:hypothetical protein n=1 Tax=uncultured Celeribacter sp. TaxID=1303376 RepID=UPI002AA829BF|nr:hypothetical protein [uncultured Celeribacter sp.]
MTDLNTLTKPALNDMLAKPLTASALKKIAKADLVAMVEAQPPKLTAMEKRVLVAYLDAGIDANGAETLDDMLADNMTWGDVPEIAQRTGLPQKQVQGVVASLSKKALLVITDEGVNGEGPVQQVLADNGIRVAFDLMAEGVEAKAEKPKARKPRELPDRVMVEPGKPEDVKATKAGSKRHLMAEALAKGATVEELVELLGWNKDTVTSAFRTDMGALGFGVERKAGKYFLLFPKKIKRLPVTDKGVSRADALVAACK